jgi:peptidoglycan/xylan/chitin deacetylase (PgdA/CDA1 family)
MGEEVPLLGWDDLRRLAAEGVEIGSHTASHPRLTDLDWTGLAREALRSRTALTQALGRPPRVIAYPYGDADPAVRHLVGACGYAFGLGCRAGPAGLHADPGDLPRIEVPGGEPLEAFADRLGISRDLVRLLRSGAPRDDLVRRPDEAGRR